MAIDLGDAVPLAVQVRGTDGQLANADAIALVITMPDGTTVSPIVSNPTVGSYVASYVPPVPGHYDVSWAATGANASAYTDVFEVNDADPRWLISLDQARRAIRKSAADTSDDEDLRDYIASVTPIVEDVIGPVLQGTYTYTTDGGRTAILLPAAPVSAVVSVGESGTPLVASVDYTANLSSGIVTRGSVAQPYLFLPGQGNISVVYNVGISAVPPNVRLAARIILRSLWIADQQGFRPQFGAPDQTTVNTPGGFPIPKRAYQLLMGGPVAPGFA